MWFGLLVGILALLAFIVEMTEQRWLARRIGKQLSLMRAGLHSAQNWNTRRGSWKL